MDVLDLGNPEISIVHRRMVTKIRLNMDFKILTARRPIRTLEGLHRIEVG